MAVVINDFEVVPESPAPTRSGSADGGEPASDKHEEKPDLADRLRLLHERSERVRAH